MRIIPMIPRSTMVHSSCLDLGYGNDSVTLECNGVRCHQTTRVKTWQTIRMTERDPHQNPFLALNFFEFAAISVLVLTFFLVAGGVLGRVWHKNHALPN